MLCISSRSEGSIFPSAMTRLTTSASFAFACALTSFIAVHGTRGGLHLKGHQGGPWQPRRKCRGPFYVLHPFEVAGRGGAAKGPVASGDRRWHERCNFGCPKGDRSQMSNTLRIVKLSMVLTLAAGLAACNDLPQESHKVATPIAAAPPSPSELPPLPPVATTPLPATEGQPKPQPMAAKDDDDDDDQTIEPSEALAGARKLLAA